MFDIGDRIYYMLLGLVRKGTVVGICANGKYMVQFDDKSFTSAMRHQYVAAALTPLTPHHASDRKNRN